MTTAVVPSWVRRFSITLVSPIANQRRNLFVDRHLPTSTSCRYAHLADEHLVEAAEKVGSLLAEAMNLERVPPSRIGVRLEKADWP